MTYLRSDIPHSRCKDFEINDTSIQSLCLQVNINKEKWLINTVYKLPSTCLDEFYDSLYLITDKMLTTAQTIVIMGDINVNILHDTKANYVKDYIDNFSLTQMVLSPTCHKGTPSLIDHFYTNRPRRFNKIVSFNCGLSDFHDLIVTATKMSVPRNSPKIKYYRSYKHFNEKAFNDDLQAVPFHIMDIFTDIDDSYWIFDKLLMDVIDKHVPPKKKIIRHSDAPFMNSALRKAMYKKRQAQNCVRKDPGNQTKWEDYRQKRNTFVSLKRSSMQKYFRDNCSRRKNSLWKTLRPYFTNKKNQNDCSALRCDDTIFTKPSDIASIFSEYFSTITDSIGINEILNESSVNDVITRYQDHPSISVIKSQSENRVFTLRSVSCQEVASILKAISPHKATGFDSFPPKLLKIGGPSLTNIITCLFNRIIQEKQYPSALKKAEVSPIFKSSDRYDKTNYRPISILPSLNTVIEKLINSQMSHFTDVIFDKRISAYRKCHNTQCVILKAVEDWKQNLDNHKSTAAVSMDLSKAFDVLPHGLLLSKLNAYGFNKDCLEIFYNYLSNRYQRIKINDVRSKWCIVKKGVPQGSVLGPVLFNLFINDIFYFVNDCQIYNYADDNVISHCADSDELLKSVLEQNLQSLLKWFKSNGMKANPSKFQLISFGNTNICNLNVGGIDIQTQSCIKYLGVHIDDKLSFTNHVNDVCAKASKQVNALMRLSHCLDKETKLLLYNSFILANYEYCPSVWSLCNKTLLKKLCKIQCRALRFVTRNFNADYEDLLTQCNSRNVSSNFIIKIAIEMYKVAKNLLPTFVNELFPKYRNNYSLRRHNNFLLKRPNTTNYGKLSFVYTGVKVWNELPNFIKEAGSLEDFKVLIYKHTFPDNVWFYVNRNVFMSTEMFF